MAGARLELYVRSLAPRGRRAHHDAVLDRLKTLSMDGDIVGYSVHVCGKRIPANPEDAKTAYGAYLHNRIAVFELWAAKNDIPLRSLFRRQCIDSTLCDESNAELVLPAMVLAEYEDSSLRFVAPCETKARSWTVLERLQALSDGDPGDETEPLLDAVDDSQPPEQVRRAGRLVSLE